MKARSILVLQRLALLVALAASAMLHVDYTENKPAYCGTGSGCDAVRASELSSIGGVSWPLIGLISLGILIVLVLVARTEKSLRLVAIAHTFAALGALALIGIQVFVIGAICSLCMVVDVAIVVAAVVSWVRARRPALSTTDPSAVRSLWGACAIALVALPHLWLSPQAEKVDVPQELKSLQIEGRINLIQFTDFQCPFCRKLHAQVVSLKKKHAARLAVTRMMVPLPNHKGADPAARAYLCTPDAYQERIADALYKADPEELTPKGIAAMADGIGLGADTMTECMNSKGIKSQIEKHKNIATKAGVKGLPASYVEGYFVPGANADKLADAIDRAQSGGDPSNDAPWLFAMILSCLGACAAASMFASRGSA